MNPPAIQQGIVTIKEASTRLDKFLSAACPDISRSRIQQLIAQGMVSLAGCVITDAAHKVKPNEKWEIRIPAAAPTHMIAQHIPLDIIYEDNDLLVINKPAGLTVHPAPGHPDSTLVNALLAHCGASLSGIGGIQRPGIVHRIDKDTSGLLVVAKNDAAHHALSAQLADRSLSRIYQALCWGSPSPEKGSITGNIGRSPRNRQKMAVVKAGGKTATTHYTLQEKFLSGGASLIECKLETGRTHQIRVHMAHVGHPLIGDPVYGQSTTTRLKPTTTCKIDAQTKEALLQFKRQALHAFVMGFIHPRTQRRMEFHAPLPPDLQELIAALRKGTI
jgi:23S rRNA pseudouridine1911/1915/1917 synthase